MSASRKFQSCVSRTKVPSFGRELFLGRFQPDLIYPQPKLDPEAVQKGEAFLKQLRTFLTDLPVEWIPAGEPFAAFRAASH